MNIKRIGRIKWIIGLFREAINKRGREYAEENKEARQEYREKNKEHLSNKAKELYQKKKDSIKKLNEYKATWGEGHFSKSKNNLLRISVDLFK